MRKGGGRQELLAKAVGAKKGLKVVDCTAGLGRDAFLLASLGCNVTMIERSAEMVLLLEDALARARMHENLLTTLSRLTLVEADALDVLQRMEEVPDAITIDPMFPKRRKSALVKGDMQVLQRFLGVDEDAQALLDLALDCSCPRVVLKRPIHDQSVEVKPTYSLKGSSVRFDVFISA